MTETDTPCLNCGAESPCECTEPMPQANTEQARYGQRRVSKMIREVEQLRRAIRAHDNEATEAAWDRVEQHIDYAYRPDTVARPCVALPLMHTAFRTTESGHGRYLMVFSFKSLADMQAADREWIAAFEVPQ